MITGPTVLATVFVTPLTVPLSIVGLLWALPICLSIAVIYKTLKLRTFTAGTFMRQALILWGTLVGFLILVAACLWLLTCAIGLV